MTLDRSVYNIVFDLEDYEAATEALTEISNADPLGATELSLNILNEKRGDVYFQAHAFDILYSVNRREAIVFVEKNYEIVDLMVLNSILECVAVDRCFYKENCDYFTIVKKLKSRISKLNDEGLMLINDSVLFFGESFE